MRFSSRILPADAPRSKNLEVLIALLYLKGISTGDFVEELVMLLAKDAGGAVGHCSEEHGRRSTR
jgi:hypothetical protein